VSKAAPGLVASKLWEVAVNPVPPESWSLLGLTSIIAYVYSVVALILGRAIKLDGAQFTYIARYTTPVKNFFLYPDVVVGFGKDSNNETLVGKLQSLGFRKESAGRRIYYRDPTTQDNITAFLIDLDGLHMF
jgi:hypothetical protein